MPKSKQETLDIEMIGRFPEHWPIKSLSQVCRLVTDGTHDSPKPAEEGFPLVTGKAIKNRQIDFTNTYKITETDHLKVIARSKPERDDILFANIGNSIGDLARVDSDCEFSIKNVALFKPDISIIVPRFLEYYLFSNSVQAFVKGSTKGSAQPFIGLSSLRGFPLPVPPLNEQRFIAKMLGDLDDKIQLNRQINQTLEQMAQAIFKSWFVDFEPVKAKIAALEAGGSEEDALLAAMQAISGKDAASLAHLQTEHPEQYAELHTTAELFPSAMQDSELGDIPAEWESIQLGDTLDILETGARPKGGVSGIHEGVPSVGAENIIGVGNYNYSKEKFVSVEFFAKLNRGIVENLDCLLYKDGGKPGDFRPRVSMFGCGFPYEKFAINEHVFRLRSRRLGQAFLYFQIAHERVLADLRHKGAKAAIPGINQTDVKSIWIISPSAKILNVFNKNIEILLISILGRSKENLRLSDLRDSLLPKLLSGELSVTEAEPELVEAANN